MSKRVQKLISAILAFTMVLSLCGNVPAYASEPNPPVQTSAHSSAPEAEQDPTVLPTEDPTKQAAKPDTQPAEEPEEQPAEEHAEEHADMLKEEAAEEPDGPVEPERTDGSAKEQAAPYDSASVESKEPEAAPAEPESPAAASDAEPGKTDEVKNQAEDKADAKDEQELPAKTEYPAFSQDKTVDGVKVSVSAPEGVFPKAAKLSVAKAEKSDQKAVDQAVEEARAESANVAVSYTFDIKVLDADGNELQPKDGQTVKVTFEAAEAADKNLTADVYHICEEDNGELTAEPLETEEKGETITAETDGFSFYTVEFTYESKQYVMQGNTTVTLADILKEVGLEGNAEDVTISNEDLFSASKKDGEWVVTAHQAFTSEEWMKVVIDGVEYEIVVTDATGTVVQSGTVETTKWELYSDGTLVLSPSSGSSGNMCWFMYPPWSSYSEQIKRVEVSGTIYLGKSSSGWLSGSIAGMFQGCTNLISIDMSHFDTSNVTDMRSMFYNCSKLTSLDVSGFNTNNVTNMGWMFYGCSSLTSLDVSKFKTSNVTNMCSMFQKCSSLILLDVSGFNTSNVTDMSSMFDGCSGLTTLDVSGFDTSNVTDMSLMFNNCSSLATLDVSRWNTNKVTNMGGMFDNCSRLTTLDVSRFNTSNVTSMGSMFSYCSGLTALDVSNFNTSNVTNMSSMFNYCSSLATLDVSRFNTSNVTSMGSMFSNCSGLTSLNVSGFNTSKVTSMNSMFSNCSSLTSLDASGFDTSNVKNMGYMFFGCSRLTTLDVSNFNTSNVTNMNVMFSNCSSLTSLDASGFDTSNVTNMAYMFYYCRGLTTLDVSNFNTSNVTNMNDMFENCSGLTSLNVSGFNTSNVTDMSYMFRDCSKLSSINLGSNFSFKGKNITSTSNQAVLPTPPSATTTGKWMLSTDHSKVLTAKDLRDNYPNTDTAPVGTWVWELNPTAGTAYAVLTAEGELVFFRSTETYTAGTGKTVTDIAGNTYTGQVYTGIETYNGTDFNSAPWYSQRSSIKSSRVADGQVIQPISCCGWFSVCSNMTTCSLTGLDTSNVTNMYYMFNGCTRLTTLDVSGFNTRNVTSMYNMFCNCSGLTSLDVSGFDTSNVTSMSGMFHGCAKLTTLDVDNFDTGKVTNMRSMFEGCYDLTTLDVSGFDTSNVTSMSQMFYSCRGLTTLDVSGFDTSNVTNMYGMFYDCSGLASLDVSGWNTSKVTNMGSMFYSCRGLTTLDVSRFNTSNVTSMSYMFNSCSGLTSLNVSGFNTSNVTSMGSMFSGCSKLSSIDLGSNFSFKGKNITSTSSQAVLPTPPSGTTTGKWMLSADHSKTLTAEDLRDNYPNTDTAPVGTWVWELNPTAGTAYAVLTAEGELVFFRSTETYTAGTGKTVTDIAGNTYTGQVYTGIETYSGTSYNSEPWYGQRSAIESTRVADGQVIQPISCAYWFKECSNMSSCNLDGLDTSHVTNMSSMFYYCSGLTTLDVSNFNTSNVTNMYYMFYNCSGLTTLDVSRFNTSKVTDMGIMFSGCSGLTTLDVSGFNTSNVTNMGYMFSGCSKLSSVNLGDNFSFKGKNITSTSSQAVLPTPPSGTTTGKWMLSADHSKALAPTALRDSYPNASTAPVGEWVWESKYTVTFNANGKGTAPASQTVEDDQTPVVQPTVEPVTVSGTKYIVSGWYREPACTNQWNFADPVTSNMTLYAKWEALVDLSVKTVVAGNMGNRTDEFQFTLTLAGERTPATVEYALNNGAHQTATLAGGKYQFSLGHDDTITFYDLFKDVQYNVTETQAHYATTVSVNSGTAQSSRTANGTLADNTSIVFTNARDMAVPTTADTSEHWAFAIMGLIPAMAGVLIVSLKRKKR